ncbi:MAG: hypothetical protein K2I52_04060, partial [Muribaculaceae bacterium]|nr:hypothetical protein [Muribaculaceae bacterium]
LRCVFDRGIGWSSVSNLVIASMGLPLRSSVSSSAWPMFWLGEGGLLCGVSLGFGFNFGDDWNMTVSGGVSNQYAAANISATCKGWGAGYGYTQHFNQPIAQNTTLGRQGVGTISLQLQDVSLRFSNDAVGDRRDRWRSNAVEVGINDFVFGTYITTGDGKGESTIDKKPRVEFDGKDMTLDNLEKLKIKKGQTKWKVGNVYSAPFWIGYKSGNQVYRIGYSHKEIQDKTQNLVHRTIAQTPLFEGYKQFKEGVYIYSGYNSPYSLW